MECPGNWQTQAGQIDVSMLDKVVKLTTETVDLLLKVYFNNHCHLLFEVHFLERWWKRD